VRSIVLKLATVKRVPRRIAWTLLAWVAFAACRRHPERTPEGTLALLRASLVTGSPPLARVADTLVYNQAGFLHQANFLERTSGIHLSETAVRNAQADIRTRGEPSRFLAGVRTLLRNGHCERIGDTELPRSFETPPAPNDGWPAMAREFQRSVARRVQGAVAGEFRCDGGPSFSAAFVHPEPDDGSLRVAYFGSSSQP